MQRKLIRHMKAESLHGRLADDDRFRLLERITAPPLRTLAALREHMRQRPFGCVAGGFGGLLSSVRDAHLVRAMQHMRSASKQFRKASHDLCNLHDYAAVHGLIRISLTLPPRLLAAGLEAEACDAFARLHARFPGLPIRCDAGGADALQQPILRVICGSSLRVSLAVYGVADFAPLAAFVAVNALVIGGRSNKIGPAEMPSLASALEKMPQLTSLDLQGARIGLGEAWSVWVCGILRGFVLWALDALRCGVLSACGRA